MLKNTLTLNVHNSFIIQLYNKNLFLNANFLPKFFEIEKIFLKLRKFNFLIQITIF